MLFNDTVAANVALGATRRRASACATALRGAQPARLRRRPAAGLDTVDRPQRQRALGRPAPAPGDRARDLQGRADPDPRRGDLGARLRVASALVQQALETLMRGRTTPGHRAPPVDHRARRPHRRHRRRPHRRAGHACRAAGRRRPVRSPARAAIQELSMAMTPDLRPHCRSAAIPVPALDRPARRHPRAHPGGAGEGRLRAQRLPRASRTGPTSSAPSSPTTTRCCCASRA